MAVQKPTPPKKQAAHTSSTKNPPKPKPSSSSTGGGEENGRRGNPYGWPVVEILWVDAISDGLWEWLDPDHLSEMRPEDSLVVGYLAHETPDFVTVASLINDDSAAHALCIPRTLIAKMTYLREP